MKKCVSLLLIFWLPLFFSVAGFASTSVQAGELMSGHIPQQQYANEQSSKQGSDHCQHMAAKPCSHKDCATSHTTCQHCGLCVNLVFYPSPTNAPAMAITSPLSNHVAWVSSPHLTSPEQRPPIFL
jgi:hypothetical protein